MIKIMNHGFRGGVSPTLNAFDNGTETRATVLIIDGTRVGDVRVYEDDVMQTVIQRWGTGGGNVPAIYPIQDGRDMDKKQNGLGVGGEDDPSYTLDTTGGQAIAFQLSGDRGNEGVSTIEEKSYTLSANAQSKTQSIIAESVVRRLTPMECERLQGFPDGWTDGQADSHRYKQMGNAVAVPVVQWIIDNVVKHDTQS